MPSSSSSSSSDFSASSASSSSSSYSDVFSSSSSSSSSSVIEKRRKRKNKKCACECGCEACRFGVSDGPVRYFDGELQYSVSSFAVGGFGFPWGHTRSYSNQLYSGDQLAVDDAGQGNNWLVDQWAYVTVDPDEVTYSVSLGSGLTIFFTKSGSTFTPMFGAEDRYSLTHDTANGLFVLYDPSGTRWEFQDLDALGQEGLLYRVVTSGGMTLEVTLYDNESLGEVERSWSDGIDNYTEQFKYEYVLGRLTSVTLRRKKNSEAWANLRREAYTYYGSADANGSLGDLRTAVVQRPSGSSWVDSESYHYRYWKDAAGGHGFKHGLKYVVEPEAYARLVAAGHDPLTVADATLAAYADYYFWFDSKQRVIHEAVSGGLRSSGFGYIDRIGTLTTYNQWARKTSEVRPDGAVVSVFTNRIGQVILHELASASGVGTKYWRNYFQYDAEGREILHAHPSAVSGWSLANVSSELAVTLRTGDGLIELTEYPTSTTATETMAGNAKGHESAQKIKQGSGGSPITLRELKYFKRTVEDHSVFPLARETSYRNDNGTGAVETSYSYSWFTDKLIYEERITTLPAISTGQNGSGSSNTRTERFSELGELLWSKDERGFITSNTYDIVTGALIQSVADVDDTLTGVPSGWSTPSGGGLHLVTDYTVDDRGRVTLVKGPIHAIDIGGTSTNVRSITTTLYDADEVRAAQGYGTGINYDSYTLFNPISITKLDSADRVIEQIQAPRGTGATSSGDLSLSDTFAQSAYTRWTKNVYNNQGQLTKTRVYHSIPSSGDGKRNVNYAETGFGYDSQGRQNYVLSPGGTGTTTTFDERGLPLTEEIGAYGVLEPTVGRSWQNQANPYDVNDDGDVTQADGNAVFNYLNATGGGVLPEPPVSPPPPPPYYDVNGDGSCTSLDALIVVNYVNNPPTATGNKLLIATYEYDGGSGGGDGNLTTETRHVDSNSANDRVTTYAYDWRNRRTAANGEIDQYTEYQYDNLDRVTITQRRETSSSGNLIAKQETLYDDLGRVYQSIRYAVNPSTGTVGNSLTDNTWHDAAGNVAKQQAAGSKAFTKNFYDGVGRTTKTCVGYDTAETSYADALTVSGDTIFEQTETTYDKASNVTQTTHRRRFHDATGTGELTDPDGTQPKARVMYTALWPDGMGRTVATANYGTNGGSSLTRPSTIPSRSDTVLITTAEFNLRGEAYKTIDPAGTENRVELDHAGRQTKTIQNYDDGDPTTGAADKDVTVEYTYNADGKVKTIKARQQSTANDQVTTYTYGVTTAGSALQSNELLHTVKYPDSADATDLVTYEYNRQGQPISMKDQNGTVHSYDYDKLGRQTHDRVTTLGSGVDGAVRRISTTYEVRGLVEKITSYDNATVGSGNVVNEVQNEYTTFSQLTKQYQAHSGVVNTSTSPNVQYAYTDGLSNHTRQTKITYPNGRILRYEYNSGADDNLSRISYLADDSSGSVGTHLAEYSYLGLGMVAKVDYTEPDIRLDLAHGAGSDPYDGLDRFNRVQDLLWRNYGTSTDAVRIKHGYDRAGNRLWREDPVAAANSKDFDELYTYDGVNQLKTFQRGNLNANKDGIVASPTNTLNFQQEWGFDPLGNWTNFKEDAAGDGTFELDQARTHNKVNEITGIAGGSWVAPAYDRNGNMTTMPQPAAPTNSFVGTYDAWNRLVKLVAGSNTVAEYAYDGQKWRTVSKSYTAGALSETRHFYFSRYWQYIEERVNTSTSADRQHVWGQRYIDELVLRDRDTDSNGSLDERLYAMQDANWNVLAVATAVGTTQERFGYDAYGKSSVFDAAYFSRSSSSYIWDIRYAGYRLGITSELMHVRHRDLHSVVGRWRSRDPVSYTNTLNLYCYADGAPLSEVDPFGLSSKVCVRTASKPGKWKFIKVGASSTESIPTPSPEAVAKAESLVTGLVCFYERIVSVSYRCNPDCWSPSKPAPGNTCSMNCKQLADGKVPLPGSKDLIFVEGVAVPWAPSWWPPGIPGITLTVFFETWDKEASRVKAENYCIRLPLSEYNFVGPREVGAFSPKDGTVPKSCTGNCPT